MRFLPQPHADRPSSLLESRGDLNVATLRKHSDRGISQMRTLFPLAASPPQSFPLLFFIGLFRRRVLRAFREQSLFFTSGISLMRILSVYLLCDFLGFSFSWGYLLIGRFSPSFLNFPCPSLFRINIPLRDDARDRPWRTDRSDQFLQRPPFPCSSRFFHTIFVRPPSLAPLLLPYDAPPFSPSCGFFSTTGPCENRGCCDSLPFLRGVAFSSLGCLPLLAFFLPLL